MKEPHLYRKRICLLMIAATILLSGCSSISTLVRSGVEGVPAWVYEPQVSSSQRAFVGQGIAVNAFNAKLLAYEDILSQISTYIGEDVTAQYYRELSTTDAIGSLRLRITQEHVKSENGQTVVHLLAAVDADQLVLARTASYDAMLARQDRIASILSQADLAYRHNRDLEAVSLYVDAAIVANGGYIENPSYQFDTLMGKIESFVSALRISISRIHSEEPSCTVTVRRISRLLPPKVLGAAVTANFKARNGMGEPYVDHVAFNTADSGSFQFVPMNPGMMGDGEVSFSIDVSEDIARLEQAAGPEAVAGLKAAVESSVESFSYSRVSDIAKAGVVVDIMEFSLQGNLRDSNVATDMIVEEFGYDGVVLTPAFSSEQEEEDFFVEMRRRYPEYRYLMYGRGGVSDILPMGGGQMVLVNGSVSLFVLADASVVKQTDDIRIAVWGTDLETATDEAFRRFGLVASSLLDDAMY